MADDCGSSRRRVWIDSDVGHVRAMPTATAAARTTAGTARPCFNLLIQLLLLLSLTLPTMQQPPPASGTGGVVFPELDRAARQGYVDRLGAWMLGFID